MRVPRVPLIGLGAVLCTGVHQVHGAEPLADKLGYKVVASVEHHRRAFTQGLVFRNGRLFESVGGYGESSLRELDPATGRVLRERRLPRRLFAEGLTQFGERLIQLTWRSGLALVYDVNSLEPVGQFRYRGEGWGLTDDGERLIMSDGSSELRFLDPASFRELSRVSVRDGTEPVALLNELEYINGSVYANIWHSDAIARIDPDSGRVQAWIDLSDLLPLIYRRGDEDVLNGIAYDRVSKRLLVTGKRWPRLFEIEVVRPDP
ncbi:MAG: glutaminyl-peptide cyclotransferase [Gammaproteobacteria bacterium]